MPRSIRKVHKKGFVVIETTIGEITIALPDDSSLREDKFSVTTDENDRGEARMIKLEFEDNE